MVTTEQEQAARDCANCGHGKIAHLSHGVASHGSVCYGMVGRVYTVKMYNETLRTSKELCNCMEYKPKGN